MQLVLGGLVAGELVPATQRVDAAANFLGLDGWGDTTAAALTQLANEPAQMVALALTSPEYVLA